MKTVEKVWGKEVWISNGNPYCGKFLHIDKEAISSLHYHGVKQETFYGIKGRALLQVEGDWFVLDEWEDPVTILPGQKHLFQGILEGTVILEISTEHKEEDVYRLSESKPAFCNSGIGNKP